MVCQIRSYELQDTNCGHIITNYHEDEWPWNNMALISNLTVMEHSQFSERSGYLHARKGFHTCNI